MSPNYFLLNVSLNNITWGQQMQDTGLMSGWRPNQGQHDLLIYQS